MRRAAATAGAAMAITWIAAPLAEAGDASITVLLGNRVADVTIDAFGRTVALTADDAFGIGDFFLYDGGYIYGGNGFAWALSADANWVSGKSFIEESGGEAARWSIGGAPQLLGGLPDALHCPSISSGYEVSADGSVVVGLSWDGCSGRAFRWTDATGMVEMQVLGDGGNRASVVSDDGQVLAGFARGAIARTPAIWNADGTGSLLDYDAVGEILAITPDGQTVAGSYGDETDIVDGFYQTVHAFYRNDAEGIVRLGWLDDDRYAEALGISADGNTVVGYSGHLLETGLDAFIWTRQRGMEKLLDYLIELGVPNLDNVTLASATAVTQDGRTVAGWGYFPGAEGLEQHGFLVTLPELEPVECPADLNGDGNVGFGDLTQLLNAWGACVGCPEDLDGDGSVGFSDLTTMLNAWGPCV